MRPIDIPREAAIKEFWDGMREVAAAAERHGPDISENMRVKEVKGSETERFVICHSPDAATRDAHIRDQLVAQFDELIAGSDTLPAMKRGELRCRISTKPGLNRYLRVTLADCCASTKPNVRPKPTSTANTCCAAQTRTSPPPTSPWATSNSSKSNAAGAT